METRGYQGEDTLGESVRAAGQVREHDWNWLGVVAGGWGGGGREKV